MIFEVVAETVAEMASLADFPLVVMIDEVSVSGQGTVGGIPGLQAVHPIYRFSHFVQVWTRQGAEALAEILHGRFGIGSIAPDIGDTLARGLWVVTLTHTGIPDKNTIARPRRPSPRRSRKPG
jgi:hypothetical protein